MSFEKDYHVYIYDENESYPKARLELGTNLVLSMYFWKKILKGNLGSIRLKSIQNKFWCIAFWIFLGIPARVVAKTLVMLSEMKSKTDRLNAAQEMENEIIVMEDSLLKQLQQEPKSSISKPESSKKVSKQLEQVAETLMPERWDIFKKLFQYILFFSKIKTSDWFFENTPH